MCGIIGVTGEPDAVPLLLGALHQLEYRGYDSAGIAMVVDGLLWRERAAGGTTSVARLGELCDGAPRGHAAAIGHTRWATHGSPTPENAHPHLDCTGRLALIHNGIIENHAELRAALESEGHVLASSTDTEVMAHLVEREVAGGASLAEATRTMLGLYLAQIMGTLPRAEVNRVLNQMEALPRLVSWALERAGDVDDVASKLTDARDFFFLGRHVGFPVALEGALKLKELAYLRAEGYPAGELKHGPIALIEPGTVVVGIATRTPLWEKMLSNVSEVRSRGATVVLLAEDGDEESEAAADHVLWVPPTDPLLAPVVGVVPLQQLAYRLARLHGHDPDRPRNLAKTVTVE